MMTFVMENCLLFTVCCFWIQVWNQFEWIILGCCFFVSQKLELNIIYIFCFSNSMKRVIQCTCVDSCGNILSKDMYIKCPKIHLIYFVNRDIYMYIGSIAQSKKWHLFQASPLQQIPCLPEHNLDCIVVRFHYTTSLSTIIELDHNEIKFCKIVFFIK